MEVKLMAFFLIPSIPEMNDLWSFWVLSIIAKMLLDYMSFSLSPDRNMWLTRLYFPPYTKVLIIGRNWRILDLSPLRGQSPMWVQVCFAWLGIAYCFLHALHYRVRPSSWCHKSHSGQDSHGPCWHCLLPPITQLGRQIICGFYCYLFMWVPNITNRKLSEHKLLLGSNFVFHLCTSGTVQYLTQSRHFINSYCGT